MNALKHVTTVIFFVFPLIRIYIYTYIYFFFFMEKIIGKLKKNRMFTKINFDWKNQKTRSDLEKKN